MSVSSITDNIKKHKKLNETGCYMIHIESTKRPAQDTNVLVVNIRTTVLSMSPFSCNNVALPYFISDMYRGGLQFRRISAVAQIFFYVLPCFSHDIHAMLSINCKYISFNPKVPCLNVILTNLCKTSLSVKRHCHVYYREI